MIKASELRIGNWIFIDNEEKPKYAYEVTAHDIEEIDGCGTDSFPIPLTPEILEKCGFDNGRLSYSYHTSLRVEKYTTAMQGWINQAWRVALKYKQRLLEVMMPKTS